MDFKEMDWDGVNWNNLAQDKDQWWFLVEMVMNNLRFSQQ
jgi:hypothetical protein